MRGLIMAEYKYIVTGYWDDGEVTEDDPTTLENALETIRQVMGPLSSRACVWMTIKRAPKEEG